MNSIVDRGRTTGRRSFPKAILDTKSVLLQALGDIIVMASIGHWKACAAFSHVALSIRGSQCYLLRLSRVERIKARYRS